MSSYWMASTRRRRIRHRKSWASLMADLSRRLLHPTHPAAESFIKLMNERVVKSLAISPTLLYGRRSTSLPATQKFSQHVAAPAVDLVDIKLDEWPKKIIPVNIAEPIDTGEQA